MTTNNKHGAMSSFEPGPHQGARPSANSGRLFRQEPRTPPPIKRWHSNTFSISMHKAVMKAAISLGFDCDTYVFDEDLQPESRHPVSVLLMTLKDLERRSGAADIGLLLGEKLDPSCFGVLGYLVMSCDNLKTALPLIHQYQQLVIDCGTTVVTHDADTATFAWSPTSKELQYRVLIDLIFAAIRQFSQWSVGNLPAVTHASFQYPKPVDTTHHQRIFGPNLSFSASTNSLEHPTDWLDIPLKTANPLLHPMILSQTEQLLKLLQQDRSHAGNVKQLLMDLLPKGMGNLDMVASHLHMSPRTLQRHLSQQNLNFQDLLRDARMELARFYLMHSQLSLSRVAENLGYTDVSSFSHAVKIHTGKTPRDWRKQHHANQSF
jgi:AraC-like DNA-binding protein